MLAREALEERQAVGCDEGRQQCDRHDRVRETLTESRRSPVAAVAIAGLMSDRSRERASASGSNARPSAPQSLPRRGRRGARGRRDLRAAGEARPHGRAAGAILRSDLEAAAAQGLVLGGVEPGEVADAVRRIRADVVHAHNLHPLFGWRALAAARAAGARTVLHLHNFRLFCAIAVAYRAARRAFAAAQPRRWRAWSTVVADRWRSRSCMPRGYIASSRTCSPMLTG